jgi:hypothetical protein
MPVLSRCPLCRAVMPESRTESRCPRCGELVLPAVRKLCTSCGKDVTREKRVRDEAGEYFCHACWEERLAARGEEPGYVCNTCRRVFPSDHVYQVGEETICHGCYQQQTLDPNALLEAAADAGDEAPVVFAPTSISIRKPAQLPWGLITLGIVLVIAMITIAIILSTRK